MPLYLADDRGRGVRREFDGALDVEAVDRFDESDGANLDEVVDRFAAVGEPYGKIPDEIEMRDDQLVAQFRILRSRVRDEAFTRSFSIEPVFDAVRSRIGGHRVGLLSERLDEGQLGPRRRIRNVRHVVHERANEKDAQTAEVCVVAGWRRHGGLGRRARSLDADGDAIGLKLAGDMQVAVAAVLNAAVAGFRHSELEIFDIFDRKIETARDTGCGEAR